MKKTLSSYHSSFASLVMIALLSACVGKPVAINCASAKDFCVGLVTQLGKIDDQALNQMAWEGIKKAELKFDVYAKYIETVDSRDYEKNIATFANAGYDLIITVGYDQGEATLAAANIYPQIKFIGVDQPLPPDKSLPKNLAGLSFAEDQMGFLAGVLATQMTKVNKVGAVCGPDFLESAWQYCEGFKAGVAYINSPPPDPSLETPTPESATRQGAPTQNPETTTPTPEGITPEAFARKPFGLQKKQEQLPTETPTPETLTSGTPVTGTAVPEAPPVEAVVVYHNEVGFKESPVNPKWDADAANTLIDGGVDVIFGADSYDENGAVSAAAKRYIYTIGINTDQYYTITNAQNRLVSSVIRQVDSGVFNLIRAIKNGNFPSGNFTGTVGYAPFHDLSDHVSSSARKKLTEIQQGLANGSIETNVLPTKP